MRPSRVIRIARVVAALAAALVVVARPAPVRADNFAELVRKLENDDSDKVRLSAALNLTRLGDARAILPLTKALGSDTEKTVRAAAAVGLGQLVTDKTDARIRKAAIAGLTRARDSDETTLVRGEADKALKAIGVTSGPGPVTPPPTGGAIYVNIGPMASKTGDAAVDAKLKAVMVKIANRTMSKVAGNMATSWPGGALPTKAMLDAKGTAGFYVDGTINEVKVEEKVEEKVKEKVKETGSSMVVSCKINMLLASYPDKSIFGLLKGGGSVPASGAKTDISLASEECVSAVVENLIANRIVPTINSKAGTP